VLIVRPAPWLAASANTLPGDKPSAIAVVIVVSKNLRRDCIANARSPLAQPFVSRMPAVAFCGMRVNRRRRARRALSGRKLIEELMAATAPGTSHLHQWRHGDVVV